MLPAELKEWRRKIGFTQEEVGRSFGVSRVTIQNWEGGTSRIPDLVDAGCERLVREWKKRPAYGPVMLFYRDLRADKLAEPEQFSDNEAALFRARLLLSQPNIGGMFIMDVENPGETIWNSAQLHKEVEKRAAEGKVAKEEPGLAERLIEIGRRLSKLPVLDDRTADEIIGYDEQGLPR